MEACVPVATQPCKTHIGLWPKTGRKRYDALFVLEALLFEYNVHHLKEKEYTVLEEYFGHSNKKNKVIKLYSLTMTQQYELHRTLCIRPFLGIHCFVARISLLLFPEKPQGCQKYT